MPRFLILAALILTCGISSWAAESPRILIIVGPTNHPPGTHEVAAGGRVLKHCLENMTNLPGIKADLVEAWPDKALRDAASTVVFIGDTFPANRLPNPAQNLADLDAMMQRGCGIVCVHYATGLLGEDVTPEGDHPLLRWMGGYFANCSCPHHESFARIFPAAVITPAAAQHPISQGWQEFTVHDEPYINNYFGQGENKLAPNVTALATSMLPPDAPKRETVSWCIERADRGRGFAIVMPHFYRNWKHEDLRRCILNGIVWTAKLDVPPGGVQTTLPDLRTFSPAAMEPQPRAPKPKATSYTPPLPTLEVAVAQLDWRDAARERDVPVKLYFPKDGAGPFPIVLFSHGLGGSRENYEYLGRHWAGCGYVSVHMQHLGSDEGVWKDVPQAQRAKALQKSAMTLSNATNRPLDGRFVIDQLVKLNADETSPLKGRLDVKSIAIAGHSFGGYTTLALAGQTFVLPLGITRRFDDPRLKAAIQMSAPVPMKRDQLDTVFGSITIPLMHMTGTKDFVEILPQTTAADRRLPYDHMSQSETCLVIFNDGDHMIFSGRERTAATPEKLSQDAAFQKLICTGATAFCDAYLKGNASAKQWLLDGGYAKLLAKQATFEHKAPNPKAKE